MSQGRQHSFATLFRDVEAVEIPIIQRDYAQGREQAEDVRHDFLTALRDALLAAGSVPLDLDFVYGSFEADADKVLSLLDGQQRLTTLFLLHWYIAMREGRLDDFKARWTRDGRSRFSYATRPSAMEFFHALAGASFALPESSGDWVKLSALLVDCNWFFLAWQGDPTVKSCLTMIDAIHEVFGSVTGSLYLGLVDEERPRVTFHFLNLHDFGLSDDLYIKMNARGKPLTPFENFKAWLVGRISKEPWAASFDADMDQKWIDFFWRLAGKQGGTPERGTDAGAFDDLFLRFMYVMAFFEACNRLDGAFAAQKAAITWITQLREARGYLPLRELEAHDAFDGGMIQLASAVLNHFCTAATDADLVLVERALSRQHDYPDLVRLYALVAFIGSAAERLDPESRTVAKSRWDRVTSNLITNSRIGEPTQAAAAVKGLAGLSLHAIDLYATIAKNTEFTTGFTREQVGEEARKAALIIEDLTRESLFREAEAHGYLQGRIGFLIDFSLQADSSFNAVAFSLYSARARAVLDASVLNSKEFLVERALLSIDDYLLNRGAGKFSFCQPNATAYRDRGENWLRVVGRQGFHSLLDRVGEDAAASLRGIIDGVACKDWRKYIVEDPSLIDYCRERLIHRDASGIYLLSRTRLSGYFVELHSYALYRALLGKPDVLGGAKFRYEPVYGDAQPVLALTLDDQEISVHYKNGAWHCSSAAGDVPLPAALERFIVERGFST